MILEDTHMSLCISLVYICQYNAVMKYIFKFLLFHYFAFHVYIDG